MTPTKHTPFSVEDIPANELEDKLLALVSGLTPIDHMDCAVLLLATCDLRPREALALTWRDVELEAHTLNVTRSVDALGNATPAKAPRSVALGAAVAEALRDRRAVQGRYFKRYAPALVAYEDGEPVPVADAPVTSTPEGKPVHPKALSRWWHDKRADFGLFGWTLADLRRARMALEATEAEAGR